MGINMNAMNGGEKNSPLPPWVADWIYNLHR